jgi:hypothetical protein
VPGENSGDRQNLESGDINMRIFKRLWCEEEGFVVTTELVLIATLLVIGLLVGIQAIRNAVVLELGDVAQSIGSINQSYSFSGITSPAASTLGSTFVDALDANDGGSVQSAGGPVNCIVVDVPAVGEGG